MRYIADDEDLRMLKARSKHLYCRLELLDKDLNILDNLEGITVDGSLTIDADSDIRRTFSSTIYLKKNEEVSKYSTEDWVDKLVHVYIGMRPAGGTTRWYSKGIYAFNTNGFTYNATEHNVSISCVDLVALLDGSLSGTLTGYQTTLTNGLKIKQAIIDTVKLAISSEFIGHIPYLVNYWDRTIPYDIDFSTETSVWSILTQLRDLYYPFEMYFDDTTFVCQEIPSGLDDQDIIESEIFQDLVISESTNVDYSEIKNCVELFGASINYDTFAENESTTTDDDKTKSTVILNTTDIDITSDCLIAITTPLNGYCKDVSITIKNTLTSANTESGDQNVVTHGPFVLYDTTTDDDGNDVPIDGRTIA